MNHYTIFRNLRLFSLFYLLCCSSSSLLSQCTITLQPDPIAGKDASIVSLDSSSAYALAGGDCQNTNRGTKAYINAVVWTWWGVAASTRTFLEFDFSSLPSGCSVTNATLILRNANDNPSIYHCGQGSSTHPCLDNSFGIHRVNQAWNEMSINWNNQPGFENTIAGQDYVTVGNNALPYNDYSINLTDMVNFWLNNPSQNYGMVLKMVDEINEYRAVQFASSDHSNPAVRPELVLTLNCSGSCDNTIEGNIFDDIDSNCVQNNNDLALENWVVEITPGPIYASTDINGYFNVNVVDGNYTVNALIPNNAVWAAGCPNPFSQNISVANGTVAQADFAANALSYCPILHVDVSSNFLRKCHHENFIVQYCNTGNQAASNVYIDVDFSNGLTPVYSDIAYTLNNASSWRFFVNSVEPGACSTFYVRALVSCNADFGDVECVTAAIFPDYPCSETNPGDSTVWDRSSVLVNGNCVGDSLACFTITNTGDPVVGDMQGTAPYRIYENNILVSSGTFQLTGGASTSICWPANGNTIRLEADQRPGHPGNSHPNAVIENCGTGSNLNNYGTTLPENDDASDISIECAEVRSSYDPNDKRVIPSGVGTDHLIAANTMLDYKIRFQNTGNDTALNIVIIDTLSSNLDISSIELGVSSHDYSFSIENNRELKFYFYNIMLPDSNVNEPLSHGFVKFKVKQMPDLPVGTVINNSASIYFDYNSPILTNNTFVEIGDMDQVLINNLKDAEIKDVFIKVFPNPFSKTAQVHVYGLEFSNSIHFEIFNALGQKIQMIESDNSQFEINAEQLGKGVFWYTATTDNKSISSGKIIIN